MVSSNCLFIIIICVCSSAVSSNHLLRIDLGRSIIFTGSFFTLDSTLHKDFWNVILYSAFEIILFVILVVLYPLSPLFSGFRRLVRIYDISSIVGYLMPNLVQIHRRTQTHIHRDTHRHRHTYIYIHVWTRFDFSKIYIYTLCIYIYMLPHGGWVLWRRKCRPPLA